MVCKFHRAKIGFSFRICKRSVRNISARVREYGRVRAPTSAFRAGRNLSAAVAINLLLMKKIVSLPINIMKPMNAHPLDQFRYCPKCGSPRFGVRNAKAKHCADCGFTYYFNSSAATVAFILNGRGELLVCRRGKEPARGTLDLPGGFIDMDETGEEGVVREVREETGLTVARAEYLFSLPNRYPYSGFTVHTLDMFFRCTVEDDSRLRADDDVAESFWMAPADIRVADFGLESVRRGVGIFLNNLQTPTI